MVLNQRLCISGACTRISTVSQSPQTHLLITSRAGWCRKGHVSKNGPEPGPCTKEAMNFRCKCFRFMSYLHPGQKTLKTCLPDPSNLPSGRSPWGTSVYLGMCPRLSVLMSFWGYLYTKHAEAQLLGWWGLKNCMNSCKMPYSIQYTAYFG